MQPSFTASVAPARTQETSVPSWRQFVPWAALAADPIVRLCLLVIGVLSLPFIIPRFTDEFRIAYSSCIVDQVLFPTLLLAFGYGLRQRKQLEYRSFAVYIMCALAMWWAVRLSYVLLPGTPETLIGDVAADCMYLGFFIFMILAVETGPHVRGERTIADRTRHLKATSFLVLLFTILAYFVVVPSAHNYPLYQTWLPSLWMFFALDLYLAGRFFHATAASGDHPYRGVYTILGLTSLCWATLDLLEGLSESPAGSPLELLWWIPLPLLVIAARIPHCQNEISESPVAECQPTVPRTGILRTVAPQVVVVVLIPVLHLALYSAGLFDHQTRAAHDTLVLASLIVSGALILAQHCLLERDNRNLAVELRNINEQLAQSRKMEAIGRLAGAVAHDFNNLLTAIFGHAEMVLQQLPPESDLREDVEAIEAAGHRAESLTQQLLAFSRRQVLQPQLVNLNAVVSSMRPMLRRLIGENVALLMRLDPELGCIRADVGQLEQVILNLCINARDAMPNGGTVIVETRNEDVSDTVTGRPEHLPAVTHVVLEVRDNGNGMDPETREHAFEPFFTTKVLGRGTGLGLATVYGIVHQSGGAIALESEPGRGTQISIYFPRLCGKVATTLYPDSCEFQPVTAASDITVLLAEDEHAVRTLATRSLEMHGYRVIAASHGEEALKAYERHDGRVDVLLTDIVMPVMDGLELARELLARDPDLKVLYVSGYTNEAAFHEGFLESTAAFLPKPFTGDQLLSRLGEVLAQSESLRHA